MQIIENGIGSTDGRHGISLGTCSIPGFHWIGVDDSKQTNPVRRPPAWSHVLEAVRGMIDRELEVGQYTAYVFGRAFSLANNDYTVPSSFLVLIVDKLEGESRNEQIRLMEKVEHSLEVYGFENCFEDIKRLMDEHGSAVKDEGGISYAILVTLENDESEWGAMWANHELYKFTSITYVRSHWENNRQWLDSRVSVF